MGFFDRFRKHTTSGFNAIAGTDNSVPYETAVLEHEGWHDSREQSDQLPSFQTNLVRKTSYSDSSTRWLHTKANPYMHKHTYGVVDHIFYHAPYPFKYITMDEADIITATELTTMSHVHRKWNEVNLFQHFKECISQGDGVASAWIVRITPELFVVFNGSHIDGDHYWRDPVTREISEIWFEWKGAEGGYTKGTNVKNNKKVIVKAKIGENAVQYIPNPDVDTPFGRSDLLPIWMTGIYRELNAYYAVLFNKKGGINGRMLVAPDSMGTTAKKIFKKEALKGLESELIEVYYPKGLISNQIDPSKIVQWIENKGGSPNFQTTNEMLAANSPLPPSFVQGPASGALGGKAPEEDAKTINRFLMSQTSRIQKLVKDINTIFLGIPNVNYMVIPYFRDENVAPNSPQAKTDAAGNPLPAADQAKPDAEIPKEDAVTNTRTAHIPFVRQTIKANSANGLVLYKGNMLSSGVYEYEQMDWWTGETKKVYENLAPEEIEKFINDPSAVKEFYIDLEHNQMLDVTLQSAIGKAILKSTIKENGITKDVTDLYFKPEWDPKHNNIFLSPIYSVTLKDNGKTYNGVKMYDQTNLSIVNCSLCSFPRSGLTGLDTSAKREEQ